MTVDFAKEYLLDDCQDCPENKGGKCMTEFHCYEVKQMAIQALEQTRWIPVSERLPNDRKKCLVTFKDGYVDIMCYALDLYKVDEYDFCTKKGKAGWYDYDSEWGYYSRDDVIAWMPLPEPYEAESEE